METIATEALSVTVVPGCGGGIARLVADPAGAAVDVLRPADADRLALGDPSALACVAAMPIAGPVSGGQWTFAGESHRVAAAAPGAAPGAPRDGEGRLASWQVEARSETALSLLHEHDPEVAPAVFPFAFRAWQHYALDGATLSITVGVANLADGPMPAGAGLEARFPLARDTTLRFAATGVWAAEPVAERRPLHPLPADWRFEEPRRLGHAVIDRCFEGWAGVTEIAWPSKEVAVRLSAEAPFDRLRLRTPDRVGTFVLGPTTQAPDGTTLMAAAIPGHGVAVLAPGETLTATMRLSARVG